MLLSERLISRIFLKPNQFWFQKIDGKIYMASQANCRKTAQNDKEIIYTIYMKPDFPIIQTFVRKL